jgi:hypothetical protein
MALLCRVLGHAWVRDRAIQGENAKGPYVATLWFCRRCGKVRETRERAAS